MLTKLTWAKRLSLLLILLPIGCHLDNWVLVHEVKRGPITPIVMIESPQKDPWGKVTKSQQRRSVVFEITADYPERDALVPERILIDGNPTNSGELLNIGNHTFEIFKTGYHPLQGNFELPAGPGDWPLVRTMRCKDRPIQLDITDAASGQRLDPDKVNIGARDVKGGDLVTPGKNTLEIHKRGYESIVEMETSFEIPVGEGAYLLKRQMRSAQVQLRFKFLDKETKAPIGAADKISLNDKATADGSYAEPGTYLLKVVKRGFKTLAKEIQIPRQESYEIQEELEPATIQLKWEITGDYPRGEEIDAIVFLDSKEIQQASRVAPGGHTLFVKSIGFESLSEQIQIPDGIAVYPVKRTLISLPRPIDLSIQYDIVPNRHLPSQVIFERIDTGEKKEVKGGEKVKPGQYSISVSQEAYESAIVQKKIYPGVEPYKIEVKLEAKPRVVQTKVDFNIDPPKDLGPYIISFLDVTRVARSVVRPGGRIRPGVYEYLVENPGYKMLGEKKTAEIEPSEQPFYIEEKMIAEPRQLSFTIDYKGVQVLPENIIEILVNNARYTFDERYEPGKAYRIMAKFAKYLPVELDTQIPPGVGPYVINLSDKLIEK